ncbi:MAG: hypothetical protein QOD72_758 [Acidimicrobiaceae bacterium]|jgi:CheY-like chemotaxis protein/HPt (histidine-containing phosphotransfer) domain-containing protein|nr:hypothetical protein [Acidimicrobiaceae bacterium]
MSLGTPTPPVTVRPARVLIVDDAASARRFVSAVLEQSPHFEVVAEARDGAEAIDAAARLQPDVVLLDMSMPGADEHDALAGLRRVAPAADVILLSAMDECIATPLLEEGALAFVPKGLAPNDLQHRLESIVGRSTGSAGVLDEVTLAALRKFGREPGEIFRLVLGDFLVEAPSLLSEIASAFADDRLTTVAASAHRLKGASGLVGATQLAASCVALERGAEHGERAIVANAIEAARQQVALAVRSARQELEGLR